MCEEDDYKCNEPIDFGPYIKDEFDIEVID